MNNIFFAADTHIGHQKALQYMPNRPYASAHDINAHDKWLIELCKQLSASMTSSILQET